jgi:hypothetical protein
MSRNQFRLSLSHWDFRTLLSDYETLTLLDFHTYLRTFWLGHLRTLKLGRNQTFIHTYGLPLSDFVSAFTRAFGLSDFNTRIFNQINVFDTFSWTYCFVPACLQILLTSKTQPLKRIIQRAGVEQPGYEIALHCVTGYCTHRISVSPTVFQISTPASLLADVVSFFRGLSAIDVFRLSLSHWDFRTLTFPFSDFETLTLLTFHTDLRTFWLGHLRPFSFGLWDLDAIWLSFILSDFHFRTLCQTFTRAFGRLDFNTRISLK